MPSFNNCSNRWLQLQFWSKTGVLWAAGVGWDGKGAKCLGTFRFLWVLYEIRPSIQREGQSQRTELTLFVSLAGCGWKWQGPSWYIVYLQFQESHPWAKLVGFHHWTNHIQLSLLCFQSFTLDFKLTWGQMYHADTRLLRRLLVPSSRCALFCFVPMWPELLTAPLHSGRVFVMVNVQWWNWSAGRPQDQLKNLLLATA